MDLYEQILYHALMTERVEITFPDLHFDPEKIVQETCYQTLQKIKDILADDTLDDCECFMKIDAVIQAFEAIGSDGDCRHDFRI